MRKGKTVFEGEMRKRKTTFFMIIGGALLLVLVFHVSQMMGCTAESLATDVMEMLSSGNGALGILGGQVHGVLSFIFSALLVIFVEFGGGIAATYGAVFIAFNTKDELDHTTGKGCLFSLVWWAVCGLAWTSLIYGKELIILKGFDVVNPPKLGNLWWFYIFSCCLSFFSLWPFSMFLLMIGDALEGKFQRT